MINVNPSIHIDGTGVRTAIAMALHNFGVAPGAGAGVRYDSDNGNIGIADTIDRFRADATLRQIEHYQMHQDAAFPAGAAAMTREYEHIRSQVFEEKRRPLNAMRLFEMDNTVPLGARSYTSQRALGQGEAMLYQGGNSFGNALTTFAEETHQVHYIVCGVEVNEFEMYSQNFAGKRKYQRDLALGRRLIDEKINDIAWNGDDMAGLTGVLNYPNLAKSVSPTAFTMAASATAILKELNRIVALPRNESGGTFRPNALAVSPDIHTVLTTRQHAAGTDTTIAQFFLNNQPPDGVKTIEVADELAGIGPNGEDGIFAFAKERESLALVMPQATTILPVWKSSPIDSLTVLFAAFGGVEMVDVGNHHLAYAQASLATS